MVDWLYSGTRATETILGGMAGGVAYSFISDGVLPYYELIAVMTTAAILMALFIITHWYYEWMRDKPFR